MKQIKMQKKTAKAACSCLLLLLLYGCASDRITMPGQDVSVDGAVQLQENAWEPADAVDTDAKTNETAVTDQPAGQAGDDSAQRASDGRRLAVYVCGAVVHPGVYELAEGSRIYEAVAMAGGMTDDASPTAVNQARVLTDGEMIEILTADEEQEQRIIQEADSDGKVNLNTADAEELKTLPGIGDAKANSILAYREQHGAFAAIEDIKNIEGIKDGIFARLEDYIKVE